LVLWNLSIVVAKKIVSPCPDRPLQIETIFFATTVSIYHPIIIDLAALYAFRSPLLTLALDLKAGWLSVVSISTNSE